MKGTNDERINLRAVEIKYDLCKKYEVIINGGEKGIGTITWCRCL